MKRIGFAILIALVLSAASVDALAQHGHHDIVIGQDGSGALLAEFDEWAPATRELDFVSGLGLTGFLGDDPGFEALDEDAPDEGIFTLAAGHAIFFEVVSLTPGFIVDPLGGALDSPGDSAFLIDDAEDHTHLDWFIDALHPDFASTPYWDVAFKFMDGGTTGYADSAVYTLRFVPEPATMGLFCLGGLMTLRRRR